MKYLDLRVDMPASMRHPMQEFVRESTAVDREELLSWHLHREQGVEYALFYVMGDVDRYRDAIDDVDSIREYNLTPVDDDSFYVYVRQETREADRRWRAAFGDRNLVVVPPIRYDDRARMGLTVVGGAADLHALVDDLDDQASVTVERVGDYDRRHGTLAAALTDRQFETVRTAVDLGYYDVPRDGSLADVADALGCAESTASTHLRKAEAAVMGRVADL